MAKAKKKRKKPMKRVLLILVGLWAVAISIVCVFEWNALKDYQKDYDAAKAEVVPEKYMDELIAGFDLNFVEKSIDKYPQDKIISESEEHWRQHVLYFMNLIGDNKLTYDKNEKYIDEAPVYDIYAGEQHLAVASLKKSKVSDEFGFRKWVTKAVVFDTNAIEYKDYLVKTREGMTVSVAGIPVSEDCMIGESTADNTITQKAIEKGGQVSGYKVYQLKNYIEQPDIEVTTADNIPIEDVIVEDNLLDYSRNGMEEFIGSVEQRVLDTCNRYTYNIYMMASFSEVAAYLLPGSEAYSIVADVQEGIAWSWRPTVVNIESQQVSDYETYGDNLFSCVYRSTVYKADSQQEETESFCYKMLFQKSGEEWYLAYFIVE